jgi:MtN3 and saliva related transmembrane protein
MEFTLTKLLGFAAATCTTTAYAPQFIKAWKSRSTTDVSHDFRNGVLLLLSAHVAYSNSSSRSRKIVDYGVFVPSTFGE